MARAAAFRRDPLPASRNQGPGAKTGQRTPTRHIENCWSGAKDIPVRARMWYDAGPTDDQSGHPFFPFA